MLEYCCAQYLMFQLEVNLIVILCMIYIWKLFLSVFGCKLMFSRFYVVFYCYSPFSRFFTILHAFVLFLILLCYFVLFCAVFSYLLHKTKVGVGFSGIYNISSSFRWCFWSILPQLECLELNITFVLLFWFLSISNHFL